jgi:tRNA(Ile)-lysidine synthase
MAMLRRELADPLRKLLAPLAPAGVAVAVSGGTDSAMLAVYAAAVVAEMPGQRGDASGKAGGGGPALHIFHVHHGLYPQADDWAARVEDLGRTLNVPVHVARVRVESDGAGIEAAARMARYGALADLARTHGVGHILLAHHRNDQAETVLLRLLRGAGMGGMAAMAPATQRDGITYLRPWLDLERQDILLAAGDYTARTGWTPVDDPSNADPRYTRAAVRTLLAPVLDERWPGWQAIVTRHARLVGEAVEVLDEVARTDLDGLELADQGRSFALARWRELSPARQAHVLRYWLSVHGARMPSEARLAELLRQLRQLHALGHDRQLVWTHGRHQVRCVRGRVLIEPSAA